MAYHGGGAARGLPDICLRYAETVMVLTDRPVADSYASRLVDDVHQKMAQRMGGSPSNNIDATLWRGLNELSSELYKELIGRGLESLEKSGNSLEDLRTMRRADYRRLASQRASSSLIGSRCDKRAPRGICASTAAFSLPSLRATNPNGSDATLERREGR